MSAETFYRQEAANRRDSLILILAVMLILGALVGLIAAIWGAGPSTPFFAAAGIGLGVLAALFSYYSGDQMVLSAAGAREIHAAEAPQLYNVVTELSLAAGIPMPRVFIIDTPALNAFATGRDPKHATVAITSGLLSNLDREELQGVLGHELSHVRNLDIRFSLLIGVLVGSIVLIADVFLRMTIFGGRGNSRNGGGVILILITLVLAALAAFFAKFIELAASRQREYLADASSVELTRNPAGLERALALLSADTTPLVAANRATQHLYIVNPLKKLGGHGWFSTHPPIGERIERLRRLSGEAPLTPDEEKRLDAYS